MAAVVRISYMRSNKFMMCCLWMWPTFLRMCLDANPKFVVQATQALVACELGHETNFAWFSLTCSQPHPHLWCLGRRKFGRKCTATRCVPLAHPPTCKKPSAGKGRAGEETPPVLPGWQSRNLLEGLFLSKLACLLLTPHHYIFLFGVGAGGRPWIVDMIQLRESG